MIWRALIFCLAFLTFNSPVQAGLWNRISDVFVGGSKCESPTISLLLLRDSEGINLEVKGKYSLFDPYNDAYISSRFIGKRRYLQPGSDGLRWGEAFPGLYQLRIRPDETNTITYLDGHPYCGSIYIYDVGGSLSFVNQLPVEDYILISLSAEESINCLHSETLAALAIVARTNAYYQAQHPKNPYWTVDAKKVNYNGCNNIEVPEIEDAVALTRHMIMSCTGIYEGVATPFLAEIGPITPGIGMTYKNVAKAKISLDEAEEMAQQGAHAAQILSRAFPGIMIMKSHQ